MIRIFLAALMLALSGSASAAPGGSDLRQLLQLDRLEFSKLARPYCERIAETTRETVNVSAVSGTTGVCIDKVRGMDVIITTTANTDDEARELLRLFNFPFPADAEKAAA